MPGANDRLVSNLSLVTGVAVLLAGAAVPVLPFVFLSGRATVLSIAASAAGLLLLGSTITLLTRRGGCARGCGSWPSGSPPPASRSRSAAVGVGIV